MKLKLSENLLSSVIKSVLFVVYAKLRPNACNNSFSKRFHSHPFSIKEKIHSE